MSMGGSLNSACAICTDRRFIATAAMPDASMAGMLSLRASSMAAERWKDDANKERQLSKLCRVVTQDGI